MGKRRNGGSAPLEIRRLVESCRSKFSTPDDFVTHFRATLPEYHRMKRQTLLRSVQRALQSIPKPNNIPTLKRLEDDDERDEGRSASRKRCRETYESERLQNMEAEVQDDPSTSSSFSVSASSGEEVGALSTATWEENNVELEVANTTLVNSCKSEKKPLRVSVNWNEKEGPRLKDLGGMGFLDELMTGVIVPLHLGLKPMAGILLHGPPGCGKTKLAHAIANETGFPLYSISATDVVSGVSGDSEKNIRELFSKACKTAPSVVFIDEIDAIASKRENLQREADKRIVTQLITSMNDLSKIGSKISDENSHLNYVLVIGATNRPDAIDSALRRPMWFEHEFSIGIPDESSREEILTVFTRNLRLDGSFDLKKSARLTFGFVGADLEAVVNKAVGLATKEIIDERKHELSEDPDKWRPDRWRQPSLLKEIHNNHAVKMSHFEEAVKMVQPLLTREGFSSIPNINFDDVGGLDSIRRKFEHDIVRRIKYPDYYEKMGMDHESGFLLYGPPGCGKTLIAQAVAKEAGVNFIHIKGPALLDKYVGESEHAVRTLFCRARTCAPCILFFDEVTYVHAGWEGSANDSRVFIDAVTTGANGFPMPCGDEFYLVDAGYPNIPGFLAPYRGRRYHLRDYVGGGRLRGKEELFNYRHSSCRNVIERCIGVIKARFPILKFISNFPLIRQRHIPVACCTIHNFILQEHALDKLFTEYSQENMIFDEEPESSDAREPIQFDSNQTAQMAQVREQIATQMWNDYSRRAA